MTTTTRIANTANHVDFQKQVRIDVDDLWGVPAMARFNSADLPAPTAFAIRMARPAASSRGRLSFIDPALGRCGQRRCAEPATKSLPQN